MKYIINTTVMFDTTEYILTSFNESTNTSIRLSSSAGRVLEELIKCRDTDVPVTRSHLFSIVWKAYGLEPSNGNLNQQISLIRKSLTYFGLDASSIITVPKRGLKLNNQLTIEKIQDKKSQILSNPLKKIHNENIKIPSPILLNIKNYMKYIITITIMIFITLSIGFIHFYSKKDNIKFFCCKEMNTCNICTLNAYPEFESSNDNYQIPRIIEIA